MSICISDERAAEYSIHHTTALPSTTIKVLIIILLLYYSLRCYEENSDVPWGEDDTRSFLLRKFLILTGLFVRILSLNLGEFWFIEYEFSLVATLNPEEIFIRASSPLQGDGALSTRMACCSSSGPASITLSFLEFQMETTIVNIVEP